MQTDDQKPQSGQTHEQTRLDSGADTDGQTSETGRHQDDDRPDTGDVVGDNVDLSPPTDILYATELEQKLEESAAKIAQLNDQYLRTQAEMENLRKRAERDVQSARKYALEKFVSALLPVFDSLEMGIEASKADNADVVKLREGTELTCNTLLNVLADFGAEPVNPEGKAFDPELHQAVSMQPVAEDIEPNSVVTVMQKGYTLNGRLIRPAMVVVTQPSSST